MNEGMLDLIVTWGRERRHRGRENVEVEGKSVCLPGVWWPWKRTKKTQPAAITEPARGPAA